MARCDGAPRALIEPDMETGMAGWTTFGKNTLPKTSSSRRTVGRVGAMVVLGAPTEPDASPLPPPLAPWPKEWRRDGDDWDGDPSDDDDVPLVFHRLRRRRREEEEAPTNEDDDDTREEDKRRRCTTKIG